MIAIGKTIKGYWPAAVDGKITGLPRRSAGQLSKPSLRAEDELGLLRRAGDDLREALWRGVRGHSQGPGHRQSRAPDPVQDQHRRGDVAARPQRLGRLAGRPAGGNRRHRDATTSSCAFRRQSTIPFTTIACASRHCPKSRKRSRSRTRSPARRNKSASRCSGSRAKLPDRGARSRKSSSG